MNNQTSEATSPATSPATCPARPRSQPAFTLIEVLVVVAIIALLISILLPSLAGARAQAKMVTCLNNLNHFGKASNMYAHEHKGYIPRDYYPSEYDNRNESRPGALPHVLVPEVMSHYLGGPKPLLIKTADDPRNDSRDRRLVPIFLRMPILQCPVFPLVPGTPQNDYQGKRILEQSYDYAVNAFNFEAERIFKKSGAGQKWSSAGLTMVSRIPTPARLIYLTEGNSDPVYLEWHLFGHHDMFSPEHLFWGSDKRMIDDYRHVASGVRQPGRAVANALFFDAHAERMMLNQMTINRWTPNYNTKEVPLPAQYR